MTNVFQIQVLFEFILEKMGSKLDCFSVQLTCSLSEKREKVTLRDEKHWKRLDQAPIFRK